LTVAPQPSPHAPLPANLGARTGTWLGRLIRPARQQVRRPRERVILVSAVAIVVIVAIVSWYMQFDSVAIVAARKLPGPIVAVFNWITDFGKAGWILWPLGILLVATLPLSAVLPRYPALVVSAVAVRIAFVFLAVALPGLFGDVLKGIIGRARPFVTGVADPFAFFPFHWQAKYASLPSGHSAAVLSIVVSVGALYPRARPYLWVYALIIMASRVIITAHHPSDVIAGALVGGIGALFIRNYFAARGLAMAFTADGALTVFPGPSWARIKAIAGRLFRN